MLNILISAHAEEGIGWSCRVFTERICWMPYWGGLPSSFTWFTWLCRFSLCVWRRLEGIHLVFSSWNSPHWMVPDRSASTLALYSGRLCISPISKCSQSASILFLKRTPSPPSLQLSKLYWVEARSIRSSLQQKLIAVEAHSSKKPIGSRS